MTTLEQIIASGNRWTLDQMRAGEKRPDNWVHCADGFKLSVIAGPGAYCTPRPALVGLPVAGMEDVSGDYPGPYTAVEVGFPSDRPEPWDKWQEYAEETDKPTDTVYVYVPVELVRDLVALHGGEAS